MRNNFLKIGNSEVQSNGGQAMLISVLFFLMISLALVVGFASPVMREFKVAGDIFTSKQSYFLAESGVEDMFYRINSGKIVPSSETISLGSGTVTVGLTTPSNWQKTITSVANVSSGVRTVAMSLTTGAGVVFRYGTQAGAGGITFENNAHLNGNLYSNGNITGSNGAYITGDAFVAGSSGRISGMCIGGVKGSSCAPASGSPTGTANAHTVTGSDITGTLYCQTGSSNNKACNTTHSDPAAIDLPITDANIADWKNEAIATNNIVTPAGGTLSYSSGTVTIGPEKIVGNLSISGSTILNITGTIWVTGNISFTGSGTNGSSIKLGAGYQGNSAVMVSDGLVSISSGANFSNVSTPGSYLLLLTTSNCDASISASPCNSTDAVSVNNNADIVIANAQNGTIHFFNNATVKEMVANKIYLKNNVGINYGSGLINVDFTSGSTGSWVVSSWKESQ